MSFFAVDSVTVSGAKPLPDYSDDSIVGVWVLIFNMMPVIKFQGSMFVYSSAPDYSPPGRELK